jgi:hydroxymethylbilane synthase
MRNHFIIGTRGSNLALIQTEVVRRAIRKHFPEIRLEVKVLKTLGDRRPELDLLTNQGKGIFCGEIEQALLNQEIDLAVHSVKDLPGELPPGLVLTAFLKREDPREVLVGRDGLKLMELPDGAVIGTSSVRRLLQLKAKRPGLRFEPIRGNVETRIRKVMDGQYDATILALAGIRRLGLKDRITEYFAVPEMVPAPGQGCIGVEIRVQDHELIKYLQPINDPVTASEISAERAFLRRMGGNCEAAAGAYARNEQGIIEMLGLFGRPDGLMITDHVIGPENAAEDLGRELAERLLQVGEYTC